MFGFGYFAGDVELRVLRPGVLGNDFMKLAAILCPNQLVAPRKACLPIGVIMKRIRARLTSNFRISNALFDFDMIPSSLNNK